MGSLFGGLLTEPPDRHLFVAAYLVTISWLSNRLHRRVDRRAPVEGAGAERTAGDRTAKL